MVATLLAVHGPLGVLDVADAVALSVSVKARTALVLTVRTLDAQGVPTLTVAGALRDGAGRPVPNAPLRLHAVLLGAASVDNQLGGALRPPQGEPQRAALPEMVTTSAQGTYEASIPLTRPLTGAELHVEVDYAGSEQLGPSHAETLLALDKPSVVLTLQSDVLEVTTAAPSWPAQLRARLADGPLAGATVQLLVDGAAVETVRTSANGTVSLALPTAKLGKPGPHTVDAALDAGAGWNAALARTTVQVIGAVRVELDASADCDRGDACVRGRVASDDAAATPLVGAAVLLHAGQQELGRLVTDESGRFAAILHGSAIAQRLPPGPAQLVAQVPSPGAYLQEGWSQPLLIQVPAPPGLGGWPYGLAVLALTLAVAGRLWWRWRQRKAAAGAQEALDAGLPDASLLHIGPPAPPSCQLRGQVLHGETGRPTAARLHFEREGGEGPRTVDAEAAGFALELGEGRWRVAVEVEEHEPLVLQLALPHDGTWDGCVLRPASCRAVVRGHFAAATRRATGQSVDWGNETPRSVEPRWAQAMRRGHAELRQTVRQVERALYGPKTNAETVDAVERAVRSTEDANR